MTIRAHNDYLELVMRLPLITMRNETQYEKALEILKELATKDAAMSKGELEYFEVLSLLIERYENERFKFPYPAPTPQEIVRSFMQDHALTQAALAEIAGEYESNISAFLAGKRNLTKEAALRLARHFAVEPALFLGLGLEQAG